MRLGSIEIYPVSDGTFRIDGGALFGVVPRVLWEKTNPPDEKNRVLLGLNQLLIIADNKKILIDTGMGDKGGEKFLSIYELKREKDLFGSLRSIGVEPRDIDIVINTHLHFDHAGGNTVIKDHRPVPAFPRAKFIVQKGELEAALSPDERTRASYHREDIEPLVEAGLLETVEGDTQIVPGVSVKRDCGHTEHYQTVIIESEGRKALFLGDLVPTTTHLRLPYIMSFDQYPTETLKRKKELLARALKENWLLIFQHDPAVKMARIRGSLEAIEVERVA